MRVAKDIDSSYELTFKRIPIFRGINGGQREIQGWDLSNLLMFCIDHHAQYAAAIPGTGWQLFPQTPDAIEEPSSCRPNLQPHVVS